MRHDTTHVITGYEPTGEGEIALGALMLSAADTDRNYLAFLGNLLVHEVGHVIPGFDNARSAVLDHELGRTMMAEALRRGSTCNAALDDVDLLRRRSGSSTTYAVSSAYRRWERCRSRRHNDREGCATGAAGSDFLSPHQVHDRCPPACVCGRDPVGRERQRRLAAIARHAGDGRRRQELEIVFAVAYGQYTSGSSPR